MPKKKARKPAKPQGTFGFLGIPCGHTIKFRYGYGRIFLNGPEETFTVADQKTMKKMIIYEYDKGEDYESYIEPLRTLTNKLWKKRNKRTNKKLKKRWVLEYWTYGDKQTVLSDIYHENERQYCAQ